MIVYQTDYAGDGRFVGAIEADPDPMVEGAWLIPAGCVALQPPEMQEPSYPRWTGEGWEVFTPPEPEPVLEPEPAPEVPVILYPADLWRRTTEDEAEQIEAAMSAQTARLRNLFRTAQTYQSDDPLWPVLQAAAVELFGEERAAELLAAST